MAWIKVDSRLVQLTHKLAIRIRDMTPAAGDRTVNKRRLAMIETAVAKGMFRVPTWATALCSKDNTTYRVNGKHTSMVLADAKELPDVKVLLEEYLCDTLEDVADVYSTFDSSISSRNTNDINKIYAATDSDIAQLPTQLVNRIVAGMVYAKHKGSQYGVPLDERAKTMIDEKPFLLWAAAILNSTSSYRVMMRGPCLAVMFSSYRASKALAEEFWIKVRDGTGDGPDCPSRRLRDFLLSTSVNSGRGASNGRVMARESYESYCMAAWRAYRSGEKLKKLIPLRSKIGKMK